MSVVSIQFFYAAEMLLQLLLDVVIVTLIFNQASIISVLSSSEKSRDTDTD